MPYTNKLTISDSVILQMKHLSEQTTNNPHRITAAMINAIKGSMMKIKTRCIVTFLKRLKDSGIGTNDVEHNIKKTCALMKEREQWNMKMKLMKYKIKDAYKSYKDAERTNRTYWKDNKPKIPANIRTEYIDIWKKYVGEYKKKLTAEYNKKHDWLREKWTPQKKKTPDTLRGIVLKDQVLSSEFTSSPRIYGNADISENEVKILNLPPEYGLYKKIDVQTMKIETERALTKLRWKQIISENGRSQEEKHIVTTLDNDTKTININNLKCSELPFNSNVVMPTSVALADEMRYHQFKEEVKTISETYRKKTRDLSNLSREEQKGMKTLKKKVTDTTILCYQTDKSGRWSCDTKDNYKQACLKHLNDPTKTEKNHSR